MMIDIAEQEYRIDMRKNSSPELSALSEKKKNNASFFPVNCSGLTDRSITEV